MICGVVESSRGSISFRELVWSWISTINLMAISVADMFANDVVMTKATVVVNARFALESLVYRTLFKPTSV